MAPSLVELVNSQSQRILLVEDAVDNSKATEPQFTVPALVLVPWNVAAASPRTLPEFVLEFSNIINEDAVIVPDAVFVAPLKRAVLVVMVPRFSAPELNSQVSHVINPVEPL